MIEIVLVRHGEPDWEPGGQPVDQPALSALGHKQARAVARELAGERWDSFYASPLRRALETARPLGSAIGLEPSVESWLAETGLPSLEGCTPTEIERFFRDAMTRDLERWWDGLPGGESFRHFYERVSSGIEGLLADNHRMRVHEDGPHRLWRIPEEDRRILIVAHEGSNAVMLSHLLGIEPVPWVWMRFSSDLCGISRIQTKPVGSGHIWVLREFNRQSHLGGLRSAAVMSMSDALGDSRPER